MSNTEILTPDHVEPSALEVMQRAEVDIQIATAKRYPRELSTVKKSMMSFATLDQETAESCFYSLPRGGKNIQGPSVRLAEIAVSCYKNLRAGTRIIQTVTSGEAPHVVVQAMALDLENNIAVTIEKRRRIVGKKRNDGRVDEDDINLASNAGSAIAFRDAIFKIVPMALVKPVFEAAKRVAIGDAKTLSQRRTAAIEKLNKMGVTEPRILALLEKRSVEDIDLNDLEQLFGVFNAIRDGQTTIDEAFPQPESRASSSKFTPTVVPTPSAGAPTPQGTATNPPAGAAPAPQSAEAQEAAEAAAGLAPQPKSEPKLEPTPQDALAAFMADNKVSFDDFRDWCESTGRLNDATSMPSWDALPAQFCADLAKNAKEMAKVVRIYGQK